MPKLQVPRPGSSQPFRYVALGDSTAEGEGASAPELSYVARVHARLREFYPHASLVNLAVGGATAADVAREQAPKAAALRPHLVTLSVGPNDVTDNIPVSRFAEEVRAILGALEEESGAVVVTLFPNLGEVPRFEGEEKSAFGAASFEFNRELRRLVEEYGAAVVDLYSASKGALDERPGLVSDDGLHPSDEGHEAWAEYVWEGVQRKLGLS